MAYIMKSFVDFYQSIPLKLNPEAFGIGFFSISWYSLMYIVGFFVVYALLLRRLKNKENGDFRINKELILNFLLYCFLGLIIGARLGEVLFYNFPYYWGNPLAIISPFDPVTHEFVGIYGMSYHGGLIGVLMATFIFTGKYKVDFRKLADFIVPAIPAGYFFGRIGNFINNELYGRITEKPWGMYFKDDLFNLRHPSQLYEAFLEGIVLFIILWTIRNKKSVQGKLLIFYLFGYAIFRFISEFFREPDDRSGYLLSVMTMGQWLSICMVIFGLILFFRKRKRKV
jgi:phosphatidylglycerol---prolipoprotein diacylglyceryl transferase